MNIEEILKQLEDSIKEPVVVGEDYYTGEGWETPNFFCLDPTTNDCKILYEYINKLQNNWSELKNKLERRITNYEERKKLGDGYELTEVMEVSLACDKRFLKEMQELEGKSE